MKRKIVSVMMLCLLGGVLYGQNPIAKGQSQLNLGVGLSHWGIPVYLGFDHGVHKDITVGAELSYRDYNEYWKKKNYYHHRIIGISANGNYHFNSILNMPQNWDLYGGLNVGFYSWSSPELYPGSHTSGLGLGAQVGGRYYPTEKLGINLEFGGGNAFSNGKLGISIRL